MRKSFILHFDSLDVLDELTDEQAGKILKAMRNYQLGFDYDLDPILSAYFFSFKKQFDRDNESYKKICSRNKGNAKNHRQSQPVATSGNQSQPVATSGNQSQPVVADSDSDNDSKSKSDSKNDIYLEKFKQIDSYRLSAEKTEAFKLWIRHLEENITPKKVLDQMSIEQMVMLYDNMYKGKDADFLADVRFSISNRYKTINEHKRQLISEKNG